VAVEQGRVPDGGDDGSVRAAAADEGRAAATAGGGVEPAAGSGCGARSAGGVAVPTLRDESDAAAARGPRGAQHAVQRVRRAVPERPARTGVPAGEQSHLLPGAALQPAPPRRRDAPPQGGGGSSTPRRRSQRRGEGG
jgi:hypothetical protein